MDDRKRIAAIIRDYIARERMSREQFAFKTKLGKSTVDKLLIGIFSDRTLSIVESQTGLQLRGAQPPQQAAASAPSSAFSSPEGPSIAVLPFTNMGADPDLGIFR